MLMNTRTAVSVVGELLDRAAHARWGDLHTVLAEDFVIIDPQSLPFGGHHHGVDGYITLMVKIGALFELAFEPEGFHAIGSGLVVLRMNVMFTARNSGRKVRLPVVEFLIVQMGRLARSEVFLFRYRCLVGGPVGNILAPHSVACVAPRCCD